MQFAISPTDGRLLVIEMNPRVSRSSALASKATGFPIAKVAAKLAVGYTLDELRNDITGGATPASFEPTIDYVVTKIPRFTFEKFPGANQRLTTQMKSVGEVMAMGRTFQESLQKALRGLETGIDGLTPVMTLPLTDDDSRNALLEELRMPGPERLRYVADAFRAGLTLAEVQRASRIDPWFLAQIEDLVHEEQAIVQGGWKALDEPRLRALKRKGFSDSRIGKLVGRKEAEVSKRRRSLGVRPVYKRVDTCAAEFATSTAYLYSTYEDECEAAPTGARKIMILGGGPNRIGQGIEFDYCCVHAALALREDGFETIMVNCNPETVSTDYDTSDRLYFEPLTLEDVMEIIARRTARRRDRAVRRPDAAQARAGAGGGRRADHRHQRRIRSTWPRTASASRSWCEKLRLRQPPNRTARTEDAGACASRPKSASRWWCARPTCSAAARWKSCSRKTTCAST